MKIFIHVAWETIVVYIKFASVKSSLLVLRPPKSPYISNWFWEYVYNSKLKVLKYISPQIVMIVTPLRSVKETGENRTLKVKTL